MEVMEKLVELILSTDLSLSYSRESDALNIADVLISHGVTVQDGKDTGVPTKWIPVTERLPEPKENPVLVVYNGCVWAAWKHDNYWELVPGLNTTCVTHWMPMPEPPKGE